MLNYSRRLYTRIRNDEKTTRTGFILIFIILGLILANVLYLNFSSLKQKTPEAVIQTTNTSSNGLDIEKEIEPTPTLTPPVTSQAAKPARSNPVSKTLVKDNFIPLGSGTTTAKDWTDVAGAQATIDFNQYSPINKIIFEASVNVPTGNQTVSVRLFNVTDKHPVWYSEVTANNSPAYLISSPIIYDLGAKTYQVQMKTQLGFSADLTQSRIHVISK